MARPYDAPASLAPRSAELASITAPAAGARLWNPVEDLGAYGGAQPRDIMSILENSSFITPPIRPLSLASLTRR